MKYNYDSFVLESGNAEASTGNQYLIVRRLLQVTTKNINLIDSSHSQPYKLLLVKFCCRIQMIAAFCLLDISRGNITSIAHYGSNNL